MLKLTTLTLTVILAFAFAVTAQVSNVKNTGCPGASYATMTAPKINASTTITFPQQSSTSVPLLVFGWMSGRNLYFGQPIMCANQCGFYVAPIVSVSYAPGTKSTTILIPNDIRLWRSCYAIQTAALDSAKNCIQLDGAVSFCIGR